MNEMINNNDNINNIGIKYLFNIFSNLNYLLYLSINLSIIIKYKIKEHIFYYYLI